MANSFLKAKVLRAAQYIRMSTDHQNYSPANQIDAIRRYAAAREIDIVRTYADEGRSGLTLNDRPALRQLIKDVESGQADFDTILVYDVSRWGRFQDVDESAHYEFVCRRVGISVQYCAEQFENDGSPSSAIVKSIKRAMAGEYSRELSAKVFVAQCRIVKQGYRLGGYAGYGLRRMLVSQNGSLKGMLERGEQKFIATDRIILVPGPADEVATVRWMFKIFIHGRKSEQQIADILNQQGIKTEFGQLWTGQRIRYMLKSEKYAGHNVWGHISFKLQKKRVRNTPEMWARANSVFEPIVEQSTFEAAQTIFQDRLIHPICGRGRKYSNTEMLLALKHLWKRKGHLSRRIIDLSNDLQSAGAYQARFGSLRQAYRLIGFRPGKQPRERRVRPTRYSMHFSNDKMLRGLRRLLHKHGVITGSIIEEDGSVPCASAYQMRFGSIRHAYELIGYTPPTFARRWRRPENLSNDQMLEALRRLLHQHGHLTRSIINNAHGVPSTYRYSQRFGSILRAYNLIGYACSNGRYRPTRV